MQSLMSRNPHLLGQVSQCSARSSRMKDSLSSAQSACHDFWDLTWLHLGVGGSKEYLHRNCARLKLDILTRSILVRHSLAMPLQPSLSKTESRVDQCQEDESRTDAARHRLEAGWAVSWSCAYCALHFKYIGCHHTRSSSIIDWPLLPDEGLISFLIRCPREDNASQAVASL
jgi:hypothetical protein